MTWGALLAELRVMLDDTSETNPKYSDEVLFTYLRDAMADYSVHLPVDKEDVELSQDTENPRKFALPADFLDETAVSCPLGNYLEMRQVRPGTRVSTSNAPLFYRRDKISLYLDADPGEHGVFINYHAMHPLPANAADTTFVLTVPAPDIELVKLYINASVNTKIRGAQSRLDRFKIGQGTRTDNPMSPEVEDLFASYREKVLQRTPINTITLSRPRKYK